jgi:hypothetical protein
VALTCRARLAMAFAQRDSETSGEPVTENAAALRRKTKVRRSSTARGQRHPDAMNDNNMLLSPADEIAAVHLMLDRYAVPRDHAGLELSLQGRIQEFAFMAATGAVKFAQRAG